MGEKNNLACPCCLKELKITHQECYESLSEHVSGTSQPSMKDGYQCVNDSCVANNLEAAWIDDGDFFLSKRPKIIRYLVAKKIIEKFSNNNGCYAVNSWNYYYNKGKENIKKMTFSVNFHYFKIWFEPREKGWKLPIEKQYEPSLLKWKVSLYVKNDMGYVHVIPFWRMTSFILKNFKASYDNWVTNHNKYSLEECVKTLTERDARFYKIFSKLLIKTLYYKKYKRVIFDYNNQHLYDTVTGHLGIDSKLIDLKNEHIRLRHGHEKSCSLSL
jgi:hypothetical protein